MDKMKKYLRYLKSSDSDFQSTSDRRFVLFSSHSFLLVLLLSMTFQSVCAQKMEMSPAQKIPSKVAEYEIIGKTTEGILVWKSGPRYNLVESYDPDNLNLKWAREFELINRKGRVLETILVDDDIYVFYVNKVKRDYTLYMAKVSSKLKRLGPEVVLDTYKRKFGSYGFKYEMKFDKSRSRFLIIKETLRASLQTNLSIELIWADVLMKKNANYKVEIESDWRYDDCLLLDDGTIFIVKKKNKKTLLSQESMFHELTVEKYNPFTRSSKKVTLHSGDTYLFNDFDFDWDYINKELVVTGFYSENQATKVDGYFFVKPDFTKAKEIVKESEYSERETFEDTVKQKPVYYGFEQDFVRKVGNKNFLKSAVYLEYIEIRKLILRSDGGVLLVGEAHNSNSSQSPYPPSYDNRFASRRELLLEHYYDDVLLFSINPDGSVLWSEILKKKQYSENDQGYFSSFGYVNTGNKIHLIFNESVSKDNMLNDFIINTKGEYKIKSVMDPEEFKLNTAPRYSKQISPSEVIVPSINYRNEFLIIKLEY